VFRLDEMRAARAAAGLSQRQLAPRCGVDRTAVQKIEAGRLVPSVALARRIEAALGVRPEAIFGPARACACGCTGETFSEYLAGHNPKAGGPVANRIDRVDRTQAGSALRAARLASGLTQGELAKTVGRRLASLCSIEGGHDLPSAELAVALSEALDAPDLFPLEPCPCGCGGRTVGGRYARGHRPRLDDERRQLSDSKRNWWESDDAAEWRETLSEMWREGWQKGGAPQRALLAAAKEGRTPIPVSGRKRQVYLGRWAPKGGRKLDYNREKAEEVMALKRSHPEWGRVTLARRTGLTEDQVRYILKQAGENPS